MKVTKLITKLLAIMFVFVSCEKEVEKEVLINLFDNIDTNVLISSEGNFGSKDGSISFFSKNNADLFAYYEANGIHLGGLIQSIAFSESKAYIILNDVNQIVVVDKNTFVKETVIETGLKNPRYMAIVGGKGYITNWGEGNNSEDDYVAVLDLSTNQINTANNISVKEGPEQIIGNNTNIYVSHKGGWNTNNIISVINVSTATKTDEITVDDAPDDILFDNNGNIIVLCEGGLDYSNYPTINVVSQSSIKFINSNNNTVTKTINFNSSENGTLLAYDNGTIFYYNSMLQKVYKINETDNALSTDAIYNDNLYGMSAKSGRLFVVKYAFQTLSKFSIINVASKEVEYSTAVGLGASKIYFTN